MGYVRITILLVDGSRRSGIRQFPEPMQMENIRSHARQLAEKVFGRRIIEDVIVTEVPADDPVVVALIFGEKLQNKPMFRGDGVHAYLKQRGRKPSR